VPPGVCAAEPPAPVTAELTRPVIPLANPVAVSTPAPASPRPPIRLEREVPQPTAPAEPPLPELDVWNGEAIRRIREARGLTVQQIALRTKVTRHHIENIEADRFDALPAPVYLRGILLSLARELRLDGPKIARAYVERVAEAKGR
jgi:hypothetical protein